MARTTVEDCLDDETGYFQLAYNVGRRATDLIKNNSPKLLETNDKPVVVALREIAESLRNAKAQTTEL